MSENLVNAVAALDSGRVEPRRQRPLIVDPVEQRWREDRCGSKHWNNGEDICADCGADLNPVPEIATSLYNDDAMRDPSAASIRGAH